MTMFDPEISRGTRIIQAIGGFLVLAILTGIITFLGIGWSNAANDARATQKQLIAEVNKNDTLQDEYNKLYKEYTDATGKKPAAASPQEVKSIPGAQGETGPKGDMGIPGQSITGASGTPGTPGTNGKDGANGANGVDGKSGADGATGATGPQGPPGADSTVPGPQGPQGPQGPAGANGNDGRGIQSVTCEGNGADSTWVVTYTDGNASTTPGPCRISILP